MNRVVVAKGPRDLATDGARLWAVEAGHPGLARHGSGDVLAGMTAGLAAEALPGPDVAILACYLVGTAGAALRDLLAEPAPAGPPARSADSTGRQCFGT
jgi:NAD(P)H-hydrate repair Nnr-like enzyme with NAD(P)H-hydrate dehydratase domain